MHQLKWNTFTVAEKAAVMVWGQDAWMAAKHEACEVTHSLPVPLVRPTRAEFFRLNRKSRAVKQMQRLRNGMKSEGLDKNRGL